MKTRSALLLLALLSSVAEARPAVPVQTEIGGFVHEVHLPGQTTRIRQWVYPVQVGLPLGLQIETAFLSLEHTDSGGAIEVRTPLDTRLTGAWKLGQHSLFTLRGSLPTGKTALDARTATLARAISRNDFNFPVKTLGEGFSAESAFSVARHAGNWGISLGAAYRWKGAYDPLKAVTDYKPGDEASLTAGLDYVRKHLTARLSAIGTFYFVDRLDSLVVFQNGRQLLLQAGLHYQGRALGLKAELTDILRSRNRQRVGGPFTHELRDSHGNDLRLHLEASWTPAPALTLFAEARLKHLTPNAYDPDSPLYQGRARLWGGGGGISLAFGRKGRLLLHATRWDGSVQDRTTPLTATNLRAALTLRF